MATATSKTKALKRADIPVWQLVKNDRNPNKMKPKEFDLLVDNIQRTGITDPILVRPLPKAKGEDQKYRIVGGHHRFEVAIYLDFNEVPCTILPDDFDEDEEQFQLVRMNMIRGHLDADAFVKLVSDMQGKYGDEMLQDSFGFADEKEWQKYVNVAAKSLPDAETQKKFKEAAKEIKTIDGLAQLLNQMFTKYGDTLPSGFMSFDHGGQKNVWIEISLKTFKSFSIIGDICVERGRTMDDILGKLIQIVAAGELKSVVDQLVAGTEPVIIPKDHLQTMPTKENLGKLGKLKLTMKVPKKAA